MQVSAACLPCLYPPGCRWGEQQALGEFYETCKINDHISNTVKIHTDIVIIDLDHQISNTGKTYTDIDNQNSNSKNMQLITKSVTLTVQIHNW